MTDLASLKGAQSDDELLGKLKDLKNSIIGNTWKKVELANDQEGLAYLLERLDLKRYTKPNNMTIDIIIEVAVIIGALANVGALTISPILKSGAVDRLFSVIAYTQSSSTIPPTDIVRLLSALLRAFRSLLVATADELWGSTWGVCSLPVEVDTGLEGIGSESGKEAVRETGKASGNDARRNGREAVGMIFEKDNLNTLLSILESSSNPQILLPIYQILSRLIVLPSHRDLLARFVPSAPSNGIASTFTEYANLSTQQAGPSSSYQINRSNLDRTPYILVHLLNVITPIFDSTRRNAKILQAALEVLAALVKDRSDLATIIRQWPGTRLPNLPMDATGIVEEETSGVVRELLQLLKTSPTAIRIAAASCLTNLTQAEARHGHGNGDSNSIRRGALNRYVLDVIVQLLEGDAVEERVKVYFILAALVSDDPGLQRAALDRKCPTRLLELYSGLDEEDTKGEVGADLAGRAREANLLALASLAFQTEAVRTLIAEYQPPFFPHLLKALRHPSYGVRAAACHLSRALSRNIAILRTSLIDSGVADEVVEVLRRECAGERDGISRSEDRGWAVEVAALGTICNLVPDFSPLRAKLLRNGGLGLLVNLSRSPHEPLSLNALWAIKNMIFRASESIKSSIMAELGYGHLKFLMSRSVSNPLRIQAFCILRNLLADETPIELSRTVDAFGEMDLLDLLQEGAKDPEEEIMSAAIFAISNLALGNERMRNALVSRVEIADCLSNALNAKCDQVKFAAIRTLRHLIEASTRSRRPRQAMMEIFQPYQLRSRLTEFAEGANTIDVRRAAGGLLDVLERGRVGDTGLGLAR